ncbi:hypothetical protein ACFL6N_07935 [Thermodesulfobacteriota bacterium]
MDGTYQEGMYSHPSLGTIRIFQKNNNWVYQCYTTRGHKPLSRERPIDPWTWALSEPMESFTAEEE